MPGGSAAQAGTSKLEAFLFAKSDGYLNKKAAAAAAKLLQSCPTLCDCHRLTRLPHPWDSPGKNTGVGCHFLLQCMKVKSESEVAQSFPTLSDPMDCSPPGSSVHGIFQERVLEWGAHVGFTSSIFPVCLPPLQCSMQIHFLSHPRD